ncbi:MAG TPA: aspartate-alanine antiporter [Candidatus Udaeobacter sp.]|jgi:putative transport protein|nr:aspartate-alanine antiporter [Candidatus Udaeobacter sp.]
MNYLTQGLREHQELAVFLTLAIGFFIGRLKIGTFSLGTAVGTLLAGVAIGQLNIQVPAVVKYVFFDLFLFTTGYKVGPQFFRALKKDALPQLAITLVLCVTCLIAAYTAAKLLGYDVGTAAGMLAGAFTESTVIGTASDAINRVATIPNADKTNLINNIPVAYAVTYLIGTAFIVWFLPNVGPKLMRVNLKEEAIKLRAKIAASGGGEPETLSAYQALAVRAYQVSNPALINCNVGELEARPKEARVFVSRVRRGGKIIEADPDTIVREGDVIAVLTRSELHTARGEEIGVEVDDKELLSFPIEVLDVVITNKTFVGKSIVELAAFEFARGVFLKKLTRTGEPMPFSPATRVERGDVMTLVGAARDVERAAKDLGYADRQTVMTDMIFVGLGIVLGGFLGLLTLTVAGLPLTLTASGGALIMGLVFGWLRAVHPTFGRIPGSAMWIFDTVGLTVFMACVGLAAGPSFFSGLQKSGVSLVFVGLVIAILPHAVSILFGRYVLKMNPVIVLGACCGAGTITAALRAVQEEADSDLPALGYTVPYAIGNIVLTAWGPVLVAMMT